MHRRSYAIWWSEGGGARRTGKLEVARARAVLSGQGGSRVAVPLAEITTVDYRQGRLQLGRRHDTPISIGSLDAPGALIELVDLLGAAELSGV